MNNETTIAAPDFGGGLITDKELAKLLKVSRTHVHKLRSQGKLVRPIRLGRSTRWQLSGVYKWIADGCPPCE